MNNDNYGDIDCLKHSTIEINGHCPYKSINLMDYSENKITEFKKADYSNDIKLLSNCDQNDNEMKKEVIEDKKTINETKLTNGKQLNGLDESLRSNLIFCNSSNIFKEISEEETIDSNPKDNLNENNVNNSIDKNPLNDGQFMISKDAQKSNDLFIDKNLISLATEKLLKNSKSEQVGEQPLMQIEKLETILKSDDLHENSRELLEQLSEQIDEQLNNELNIIKQNLEQKTLINESSVKDDEQIELLKEQLIEQLNKPLIEQITKLTENIIEKTNLKTQEDLKSNETSFKNDDSLENKTISQYQDDTRDSMNTTPIDSEFSFKYSSNRTIIKDNSCDYEEEVFDESYYDDDLNNGDESYLDRLQRLEEEQEHLNSSLIALTSHFAQVQLRLKQIVDASPESKETLLKDLEEFAFRGIPDYRLPELELDTFNNDTNANSTESTDNNEKSNKLQLQRDKQKELILKLKEQLEDLEKYAYETGDPNIIPSSMIMEKQNLIIEELKGKLPLELDKLEKMSPEELKKQIDKAIRDVSKIKINFDKLILIIYFFIQ